MRSSAWAMQWRPAREEMGDSNMGQVVKDFEYFTRNLEYDVCSVYNQRKFLKREWHDLFGVLEKESEFCPSNIHAF